MNNQNAMFSDRDRLQDVLASQKFITENYNTFTNECVTPQVRGVFMSILKEEHDIQNEIFVEMQKRGWYQVQPAEQQKIQQTKTKFGVRQIADGSNFIKSVVKKDAEYTAEIKTEDEDKRGPVMTRYV